MVWLGGGRTQCLRSECCLTHEHFAAAGLLAFLSLSKCSVTHVLSKNMNKIKTIMYEGLGMEMNALACGVQEIH